MTTTKQNIIPPPKPERRRPFSVRISATLHKNLKKYVAEKEVAIQDICESALSAYITGKPDEMDAAREPLTQVTPTERHDLLSALDLLRSNHPAGRESRDVLLVVLKNWRRVLREHQDKSNMSVPRIH